MVRKGARDKIGTLPAKPLNSQHLVIGGCIFDFFAIGKEAAPGLLESTWNGVVARSPGGETIGVLRIMNDAPGWFSIWDVAVVPDWQAHRIGSAMMQEALAMIREASPGAIVYLFTFKHGSHQRLGFGEEKVSMRRL